MRARWLTIFILGLLIFTPSRAAAQAEVAFDTFQVAIWPEYDRPETLVIYRISLAGSVTLPAEVSVRIPVQQPNAVAMFDMDGTLVNLDYTSAVDGIWTVISFDTPVPDLQIEYYDAGLKKDGAQRSFSYYWPGGFAVRELSVQVLQPVGATDMKIERPTSLTAQTGPDGLVYHNAVIGPLEADTHFRIDFTYQKQDDALSFNAQAVEPVAPVDDTTSGRRTIQEVLPLAAIGLGLVLIVGGAVWYWQSGRQRSAGESSRRKRHEGARGPSEPETASDAAVYCHQCGKRAGAGDVFCRTCGTKLRV